MSGEPTKSRSDILGVQVSAIDMGMAIETISSWIAQASRKYVCVTSVHGIMESTRSEELRRIHNAAGIRLLLLLSCSNQDRPDRSVSILSILTTPFTGMRGGIG